MGQIWTDATKLARQLYDERRLFLSRIVATSGGFDPLHVGHLRCIQESRRYADRLVVILNGDGFLLRKKGYVFMPQNERAELVAALGAVDDVLIWDDGSQFVHGALAILRPQLFTKGGDRSSPAQIAPEELETCRKIGCRIEYGVGGFEKVQSSSRLASQSAVS